MSEVGFAQERRGCKDTVYSHRSLETRWQDIWRAEHTFATPASGERGASAYVFADCTATVGAQQLGQIRSYAIADTCARFLRAQGRAVLFSVGFDSFAQPVNAELARSGLSPSEAQRHFEHTCARLESLGCSCDWDRAFASSQPDGYRWSQRLFLVLLERGLIYRRAAQWFMRLPYAGENEKLDTLGAWDETAIEEQRRAIGLVDGVEIQASTFGKGDLTVFTPHGDAIANATFVAISPAHTDIDRWVTDPAVANQVNAMAGVEWRYDGDVPDQVPMVVTDSLAIVPGVPGMLPIVVSPLVDRRYGATAVLGLPELDALDQAIAKQLPPPAGTAWKTSSSRTSVRPAVRYCTPDIAVSRTHVWGTPIPVVDCPTCGAVPVPADDLPVCPPDDLQISDDSDDPLAGRADFYECVCPSCGAPAKRETATIDPRIDRMWLWMALCASPEQEPRAMTDRSEYARWLPVEWVISDVDGVATTLERRILARILQDADELPALPDGEPFAKVLVHNGARPASEAQAGDLVANADLDEATAQAGADAVRLALLYSASRGRTLRWNTEHLRYCQRFLERLYAYAEPRLRERGPRCDEAEHASIDTCDKLRTRLALWCAVACEKITTQYEEVELQRAAHNTIRLLTRIEDFESRALHQRGQTDPLDDQAIVVALLALVRLIAPLTPHIAEELWSAAGNTKRVSDAGWPAHRRPCQLETGQ